MTNHAKEAEGPDSEESSEKHQWSGWPGAYCLKCGVADQNEICIATHNTILYCIEGHFMCEEKHLMSQCEDHKNDPCTK